MTYQEAGKHLTQEGYTFETSGFIDVKGVRHLVEYWQHQDKGWTPQVIMVHNTQIATLFKEVL